MASLNGLSRLSSQPCKPATPICLSMLDCRTFYLLNNTPHATTKASPAQLLLQRSLRTRLDLIRPSTRSVVQQQQCAQAGNTLFQPARDLPVGATAMVRDYRPDHPRWISLRSCLSERRSALSGRSLPWHALAPSHRSDSPNCSQPRDIAGADRGEPRDTAGADRA